MVGLQLSSADRVVGWWWLVSVSWSKHTRCRGTMRSVAVLVGGGGDGGEDGGARWLTWGGVLELLLENVWCEFGYELIGWGWWHVGDDMM